MASPRRFQFHLSTVVLGMLTIGLVMPKIINAFRLSKTDGAAVLYTVAIPFVLGALEFEAFLARRDAREEKTGGSKPPPLNIPFPVLAFVLELALIGLWALTAARMYFLINDGKLG